MPKKTVFTPENLALIKELRERKIANDQIAKIVGISKASLIRAVHIIGLPLYQKKPMKTPVVAQVAQPSSISLAEMAVTPKAKPAVVTHDVDILSDRIQAKYKKNLRTIQEWPALPDYFRLAELSSRGTQCNPFRLKGRACEFDRNRSAVLEEVEGEIDKVFRKFRSLAGPNTQIDNPEVFGRLSSEARAAYDHLQALMSAARRLRLLKGEITEVVIELHKAGAAATRVAA